MKQVLVIVGIMFVIGCKEKPPKFVPVYHDSVAVIFRVAPDGHIVGSKAAYSTKLSKTLDSNDKIVYRVDTSWVVFIQLDTMRDKSGKPIFDSITHQPQFNYRWDTLSEQSNRTARIQIVKI